MYIFAVIETNVLVSALLTRNNSSATAKVLINALCHADPERCCEED